MRLVSLGASADLEVTPDLERHTDGSDFGGESRRTHGLIQEGGELGEETRPAHGPVPEDDEWLADEDLRLADLPFAAAPTGREQADIEEPELSGDFEAVQDTDASGSFPAAVDPFAAGGYDVDPFDAEAPPAVRRHWSDRRYGDRVEGWVRPQYRDEPASGDYWTPVPDAGYGWPVPVERIPAVPPSGAEPEVESEPTALVPQWPPVRPDDRIGAPRSWSQNDAGTEGADDEKGTTYAGRPESVEGPVWTVPDLPDASLPDLTWTRSTANDEETSRYRRTTIPTRRRRHTTTNSTTNSGGDPTQHLPAVEADKRPRPRPRPRPGSVQPDTRSTVYVSKHAAEPS
ncbi:hypothetical protein AB0J80_02780 [Actinoplanes sp. NPDC049548]|uniref:hypothetical protein n=1 Tax=Actinoplanes sp. NPDC049548 TaxID=3155152 RepID=UPI003431E198